MTTPVIVAAATHRAQHIRRLLFSVKLVATTMTKFATVCDTTQDGRHDWIASVQALAPDVVHHGRRLRFAASIACKREVAGSCERLAVQPTEWALSGGRERYGALGLSTLPRPSGAVTHCAWLSTGGHGLPIAKCVTFSGQEPRGWVAERFAREVGARGGRGGGAARPIGGCTCANGSSPARLKISWPPLFSARGRGREADAPRASLYLKGLTANAR